MVLLKKKILARLPMHALPRWVQRLGARAGPVATGSLRRLLPALPLDRVSAAVKSVLFRALAISVFSEPPALRDEVRVGPAGARNVQTVTPSQTELRACSCSPAKSTACSLHPG